MSSWKPPFVLVVVVAMKNVTVRGVFPGLQSLDNHDTAVKRKSNC
jgi:hypothetical protein